LGELDLAVGASSINARASLPKILPEGRLGA
jgi:hypothetical protein